MVLPSLAGHPLRVSLLLTLVPWGTAASQPHPVLESLPSERVAYLQRSGDRAGVPEAIREVVRWVGEKGLSVEGSPTAIFYADPGTTPPAMLFWEVRVPVSGPARPGREDEVRYLSTEAVESAACIHRSGKPGDGGPDLEALQRWMRSEGLQVNGPRIENYLGEVHEGEPVDTRLCFPVIQR